MYQSSYLEKRFGLVTGYFKRAYNQRTKTMIEMIEDCGILFVKLDDQTKRLIEDGYISTRVKADDDFQTYDHILVITKTIRIGFYK